MILVRKKAQKLQSILHMTGVKKVFLSLFTLGNLFLLALAQDTAYVKATDVL